MTTERDLIRAVEDVYELWGSGEFVVPTDAGARALNHLFAIALRMNEHSMDAAFKRGVERSSRVQK